MDDDSRNELEGLVVSFLQSCLNEHRYGVTLQYFERFFCEKTDEARDWYTRFKARNTLEALKAIPNAVCIANDRRTNDYLISINKTSDKADPLLIDLITGQKSSAKRKRPVVSRAASQRVVDSFNLNRRYSNTANNNTENRFRSSLNNNQNQNSYSNSSSRYTYHAPTYRQYNAPSHDPRYSRQAGHSEPVRPAPVDPRLRQAPSHTAAPPQVRPSPVAPQTPRPPPSSSRPTSLPTSSLPTHSVHPASQSSTSQRTSSEPQRRGALDPNLEHKRSYLRQRLIQLLMKKSAEIKLLYLPYLYNDDYGEELDPIPFGHKSISTLLQEPFFSEYFKIEYKDVFSTVSLKIVGVNDDSIAPTSSNGAGVLGNLTNGNQPFGDTTRTMTAIQKKFNAIDPFNISTMIQSLEPLRAQEPVLGKNQIEDIILYRTMRIIYTDENQTLKLEDWERKYQQAWNYNNRIRVSDYGCRTLLEFFKCLAADLPIKIYLVDDEWVAKSSKKEITEWIKEKLCQGKYKALIVADPKYDLIAFPGDTYPLLDISNPPEDFQPVQIKSVNKHGMWLQIRNKIRIRDHLAIETSLTCYEDHKRNNYFSVVLALVRPGFPCVAFDEAQQRWCRAVIIEVPPTVEKESIVTAFLVEYGETRRFSVSKLSCILKSHLKHPVGLVYAQLEGIEPQKADLATRMLRGFISPPTTLACKIVGAKPKPADELNLIWPQKKDIRTVILINTKQETDCNLADAINSCTSMVEKESRQNQE